jgi:hypothetical protein
MLSNMYSTAKSLVLPVARQWSLLEQVKYSGEEILSPKEGNDLLARAIRQPVAIGKLGASELGALRHYLRHEDSNGHCTAWGRHATMLYRNAGVYPPDSAVFSAFCKTYMEALTDLDVLAVWFRPGEYAVRRKFAPKATLTALRALEPFYHERPWSQHLAGKRVLVVSPFTDTIQSQYQRRQQIWRTKPEVLPDFRLLTLRCPLSAFLASPAYPDWCAALDAMREQMSSIAFDVAIVGAGAWSLSLVSHAKSLGAFAIHLGGAVQILFGIKGGRWDTHPQISPYFNEAWTRPSPSETPHGVQNIEGGCYW